MRRNVILIVAVLTGPALSPASPAAAAGIRTHVQMCVEALTQQLAPEKIPGISDLFADQEARRAFYHGCMFPDWGFAVQGMKDAAEDAHWDKFQTRYLEILKDRFPLPWNGEAKREIAFYLGAVAHGAQDIPWHFDGPSHPSYLRLSEKYDKLNHGETEKRVDALVYIRYHREPGSDPLGKPDCAWPFGTLLAVYGPSHPEVTKEKLQQGCQALAAGYLGTGALGELHRKELPKKHPWNAAHLADYYYGGIEAGASMTSMLVSRYFARLRGGVHFQRDIAYQKPGEFIPFEGVADAHVYAAQETYNTGLEPLFELTGDGPGDERYGVIRFDLSALPARIPVGSARLWLYLAGRRGNPQTAPKVIAAYPLTQAWKEGTGETDGVAGFRGVPSTGGGISYKDGVGSIPGDPVDAVTIELDAPVGRWISWDVTPIVRRHIAHPEESFGILLRETRESAGGGGVLQFLSSQALKAQTDGYGGGARLGRRPALVVMPPGPQGSRYGAAEPTCPTLSCGPPARPGSAPPAAPPPARTGRAGSSRG